MVIIISNQKLFFLNKIRKIAFFIFSGFFYHGNGFRNSFNQPFKNKIRVVHNKFYKVLFNKKFEKIERIENTSFGFSLFLILNKLFKEEDSLSEFMKEILLNSICHWRVLWIFQNRIIFQKYNLSKTFMKRTRYLFFTHREDSLIDLYFFIV